MSRMQVQIIDESPIVNHQMNPPGSAGANQIPGVPQGGLPRAGFQSYGSSIPSLSTTLPRTNNGVPSKMPPGHAGGPTGAKAKAGKLGPNAKKSASAPQMSTSPVQAYAPYKGWNPNELAAPQTTSTQKNVRGVLHWARAQH
jgi:hypothetical protein